MYSASGSKVQISVRCTGLVNLDRFSKSDPMCVLFEDKKGAWIEQGRTEVIKDNLNPDVGQKSKPTSSVVTFFFLF